MMLCYRSPHLFRMSGSTSGRDGTICDRAYLLIRGPLTRKTLTLLFYESESSGEAFDVSNSITLYSSRFPTPKLRGVLRYILQSSTYTFSEHKLMGLKPRRQHQDQITLEKWLVRESATGEGLCEGTHSLSLARRTHGIQEPTLIRFNETSTS